MAKILIVDDSENMRSVIKTVIEEAGHTVIEAVDGLDGVSKAEENKDFDLVVTDFNMPNMDGIGLTKAIKKNPSFQKIPVLMLSTEASTELKRMGKEAGVLAWITKPFQNDRLLAVITKILEMPAS